jgi:hypothetical protein
VYNTHNTIHSEDIKNNTIRKREREEEKEREREREKEKEKKKESKRDEMDTYCWNFFQRRVQTIHMSTTITMIITNKQSISFITLPTYSTNNIIQNELVVRIHE